MPLSDPHTSCRQTRHRGRDPRPMRVSHVTRITFPTCRLHYPDGPDGCRRWLLPRRCKPSPFFRRVGVRHSPFGACSEFTRVTARWVARPPEAAFVAGLRSSRSPDPTARQLPDLTNNCLRGSRRHWRSAPSWRTKEAKDQGVSSAFSGASWQPGTESCTGRRGSTRSGRLSGGPPDRRSSSKPKSRPKAAL